MVDIARTAHVLAVVIALSIVSVCVGSQASELSDTHTEDEQAPREVEPDLPDVLSINEDARWPQDLVFRIIGDERLPDGRRRVVGKGMYQGGVVGLAVVLSAEWEYRDLPLEGGGAIALAWSTLEIRSIGEESDGLLRALAEVYGSAPPDGPFVDTIVCDAVYLGDDPAGIEESEVRIKIFTGQGDEPDYAEAFVNIDLTASRMELAEKAPDYRAPLLRSLTGNQDE